MIAVIGVLGVTVFGTVGYMLIAGLNFVEALYQTVFTVATVGYSELYERTAPVEVFTILLIVLGVGTVLYNLEVLVEAVTEGHLREYCGTPRVDHMIAS